MDHVLVFTPEITSRIAYVFQFLGTRALNLSVSLTDQRSEFQQASNCLKINYGQAAVSEADLNIPATGLLSEKGIRPITPTVHKHVSTIAVFPVDDPTFDLPFDLPSAVFYLLSRYEEYVPFTPDQHGRFPANQSFAYRHGFLDRPLINEWLLQLRTTLEQKGLHLPPCPLDYRFLPTYDIDLAWAFRERPVWYQIGALLKDSLRWNWDQWKDRLLVLSQRKKDPYDTYDWLDALHQQYQVTPIYFWLLGDLATYDRNISTNRPAFKELVRRIHQQYLSGIHPSYRAADQSTQLTLEVSRYREMTGEKPVRSRQHYLRLSFPNTYQELIRVGIEADYTLGYAAEPGFRASYAGPFFWYDLSHERETHLEIHPFCVMDGTLRRYKNWTDQEAASYLSDLVRRCQQARAPLVSLWHNSSFYPAGGWDGMKDLYQTFLAEASTKR